MRRMPHQMQEDGTLLDINLILLLSSITVRAVFLLFFCHNFYLDAVDTTDQLGFEDRLALLFPSLIAWSGTAAVDARRDGYAVDFEGAVAVDGDEQAVETIGQCNGHFGRDLDVRVDRRDDNGSTMGHLLLRAKYGSGPGFCEVEGRMRVQSDLGE